MSYPKVMLIGSIISIGLFVGACIFNYPQCSGETNDCIVGVNIGSSILLLFSCIVALATVFTLCLIWLSRRIKHQ